ncbi:ABC transporter permease [Ramlibacter henchirensis]|uniref:ABC transporter permease n=1 Tax=Ramlibacter henchirensis TaxID=204072 RepID=A0A4Z0BXK1_9BURK|nr:ABC transporter permease [Ramlibacter henchirensis]TFZ02735.1 ABC transporter permease [Ramlibacter henchirensis]
MKDAAKTFAASLVTLAVLVTLWWWLTLPGGFEKSVLPSPLDVAGALRAGLVDGTLHPHIAATARAALAGLALGVALGVAAGSMVVLVPVLEMFLLPVVTAMQSIPKVALAPLIVAYLGFGIASKIFTAALLAFFPAFLAAVAGLRSADRAHLDLFRACSASPLRTLWHVRLPAAAPFLFGALQVAVVFSLIGVVVSEFIAATQGLGFVIKARSLELDVSMMFAAIIVLCAMGAGAGLLVRLLQRRIVFWRHA